LKKLTGKFIDFRQYTFSRSGILDSVLLANEVLDEMKMMDKSCVFLKVDYEKV